MVLKLRDPILDTGHIAQPQPDELHPVVERRRVRATVGTLTRRLPLALGALGLAIGQQVGILGDLLSDGGRGDIATGPRQVEQRDVRRSASVECSAARANFSPASRSAGPSASASASARSASPSARRAQASAVSGGTPCLVCKRVLNSAGIAASSARAGSARGSSRACCPSLSVSKTRCAKGGGSSSVLSILLAAWSFIVSAPSITKTRRWDSNGVRDAAPITGSSMSPTSISAAPLGRTHVRSG